MTLISTLLSCIELNKLNEVTGWVYWYPKFNRAAKTDNIATPMLFSFSSSNLWMKGLFGFGQVYELI